MTGQNEKGRYWAGLIYPGDSCPDDWQETMKISGLEILVSPLHDMDVADKKTGELKKPHRHIIAMWRNTTTRRNAEKFFAQFGGPKTIIRLESPRGMARYLIHLDNPEKAQYPPQDVLEINGADWARLALTESTKGEAMAIVRVVEDEEPKGYFDLLKLCEMEHKELVDFATRQTVFCREVIWSYWHRAEVVEGGRK
ncbi:Rep family protein [Bifidobacterium crudilactis]|uniref:Rep family protein n=1 Tax=Bifidobacterium crudilactis TaxID=327277 RepID=UPI0023573AD7|nr:Rep family protein [Bifidobacterium crudilactis]MCI1218523.1 replication protein [Bifidobacterium crudilactis]